MIRTMYRNKRNNHKFIEVHNDGYYHNSIKQLIIAGDVTNPVGDGCLHRWRKANLMELLEDYVEMPKAEYYDMTYSIEVSVLPKDKKEAQRLLDLAVSCWYMNEDAMAVCFPEEDYSYFEDCCVDEPILELFEKEGVKILALDIRLEDE